MKYYLSYGSNLNVSHMRQLCPTAEIYGRAKLEGWRLLFRAQGNNSYLTVEKREGFSVPVAVWTVAENDEAWLDHYEGFPKLYYKKEIVLPLQSSRGRVSEEKAFIYLMREPYSVMRPRPEYVVTCVEGYRDFGFDLEVLFAAAEEAGYSRPGIARMMELLDL